MNALAEYRSVQRSGADDAVARHADLVRRIAHHLAARLPALDVPAAHVLADRLSGNAAEPAYESFRGLLLSWLMRLVRVGVEPTRPAPTLALAAAPLDRLLKVWEKTARLFARADSVNLDRKLVLLTILGDLAEAARR